MNGNTLFSLTHEELFDFVKYNGKVKEVPLIRFKGSNNTESDTKNNK